MREKMKCYDRKEKKIKFLSKEEYIDKPDYIIKSEKYQLMVRDLENNVFSVFKDNDKLKSGELIPANAKHIYHCDIHGRVVIENHKRLKAAQIPDEYKIWCPKCKDFYLSEDYRPTAKDKLECRGALNEIHFVSSNQQVKKYFEKYMPHFSKIINEYEVKGINGNPRFSDKIYFIKNNILSVPKCSLNKCNNNTELLKSPSLFGFTQYCNKHKFYNFSSKEENLICEFIKKNYNGEILQNYREMENQEIDIFLPELKLGIEFNGLYWHSEIYKNKNYHLDKLKFLGSKDIQLLTIWEDDWKFNNELIQSILLNKINRIKEKKNARECEIKIVDKQNKYKFLNENHIQKNCPSSINLGLYANNELVALMTFGKKRKILNSKSKDNEYELLRFCNLKNVSVRGGASKLFKYFINNYNPKNIISYANRDISSGKLYEILGFKQISHTGPNYWWSDGKKKIHRSNFMKHKLIKEGFDKSKTESEIMHERGYYKIWGTGNLKYEWYS